MNTISRNVMLLEQFLPAVPVREICMLDRRALEAISSPITLLNVELFQKFYQNRLNSKLVIKS